MHSFAILYIFFALYTLALLFVSSKQKMLGRKEYVFLSVSFLTLMFFHVFVDTYSVEDLYRYEDTYKRICNLSFSNALELDVHFDYMWVVFNKLATFVTGDFTFLLFLYNIILLGTVYLISNKYSPYMPVSIIIFIVLSYEQSLFVLRQYLAIAIVLWTIPCIINKKLLPYIGLCVAAYFFHKSAIIWIPLYFLYNIENLKIYIGALVSAIVVIGLICSNPLIMASFFDDYYIRYLEGGVSINVTAKLISLSYLICYILFAKRCVFDRGINKMCFTMLLVYTVIYCFAPPVGIITRILKYFELSLFLVIPITMSYIKSFPIRVSYLISILILQGYLFIRGLDEDWISNYRIQEFSFQIVLLIFISMLLLFKFIKKSNTITNGL